jgi:hypothetical protein
MYLILLESIIDSGLLNDKVIRHSTFKTAKHLVDEFNKAIAEECGILNE